MSLNSLLYHQCLGSIVPYHTDASMFMLYLFILYISPFSLKHWPPRFLTAPPAPQPLHTVLLTDTTLLTTCEFPKMKFVEVGLLHVRLHKILISL